MINYEIAFTWKTQRLLIKLAIVSNPKCDEELIELCDSFYKQYIECYKELRIYFFREFQDAANYYSFVLEQNEGEETSLTKSQCLVYCMAQFF